MPSRREFLKVGGQVFLAGLCRRAACNDLRLARGPYVQDLASDRAIIRWTTTKDCVGEVEIGSPNTSSYRVGARTSVIEPWLTDQWYVSTKPLASEAIKVVEEGQIQFVPKQYENMYFAWMRDIQDWCISRQLWWGHQIPAWYADNGKVYVAHDEAAAELLAANDGYSGKLKRDEDVLDTWYSSALWHSTYICHLPC